MNKRILMLILCVLLSGCGGDIPPASTPQVEPEAAPASMTEAPQSIPQHQPAAAEELPTLWPDSLEEIEALRSRRLEEFTARLSAGEPAEEYTLHSGTGDAIPVTVLGSGQGPCVYVVGGVHGDEPAGWLAGELLKRAEVSLGTVYIVAPANAAGADALERTTAGGWDLNRAFPGGEDGSDAQRIAAAIYSDIREKQPDLVLDLHEARPHGGERDSLGNSVICHSQEEIGDLILEILVRTQAGELCDSAFTLYGTPPQGSLNRTVAEELGIPAITIETDRTQPLERRIANQLDLVGFILAWLEIS